MQSARAHQQLRDKIQGDIVKKTYTIEQGASEFDSGLAEF